MIRKPEIDKQAVLISFGMVIFITIIIGPDLDILLSIFIFIDLTAGFINAFKGMRAGRYGYAAGGSICALIAISSTAYLQHPNYFHVFIQIIGSALGVSGVIMQSASDVLDK